MATADQPDHRGLRATGDRAYGRTILHSGARAHLGDISQDLNVAGDLHLHLHTPFDVFKPSGSIVYLLHLCSQLSFVSDGIIRGQNIFGLKVRFSNAQEISALLKGLHQLRARLKTDIDCGTQTSGPNIKKVSKMLWKLRTIV